MALSEAAAMPFPREDTTPPVTNTYLVMIFLQRKARFYPITPPRSKHRGRIRLPGGGAPRRAAGKMSAKRGDALHHGRFRCCDLALLEGQHPQPAARAISSSSCGRSRNSGLLGRRSARCRP